MAGAADPKVPAPPHIIILSDGTGNSSSALFRSNVWKLYKALDLRDPADVTHPRQFAFYDDGVGTSTFRPLALLGGAFGLGLARNVRELYAFVCRTYRPGAKIYCFGFSRGAFTIRIVAGMLQSEGLVPYDGNEAALQRNVAAAYREFRTKFNPSTCIGRNIVTFFRGVRDITIWYRNFFLGYENYNELSRRATGGSKDELRIAFVGVFDTVDAYGLPVDELTKAIDAMFWPLSMPDYNLGNRVDRAMQALALDEERNTFFPRLWNEGDSEGPTDHKFPNGREPKQFISDELLSQVWFAGVHSDVGGSYPDDAVSFAPLDWIMQGADAKGLKFLDKIWADYRALADENGPLHDSRKGLAGYYRYNPRRISRLINQPDAEKPVDLLNVKIHESAIRRIQVGHDGYAPIGIPKDFRVVKIKDGAVVSAEEYFGALNIPERSPQDFDADKYAALTEDVYNLVWWRRVVYFLTLLLTFALVAMPLYSPGEVDGACQGSACVISPVFTGLGNILPDTASTWLNSFASNPSLFLWLAAFIWALTIIGGWFKTGIADAMRSVWNAFRVTRAQGVSEPRSPKTPSLFRRALQAFRTHWLYQKCFRFLTKYALPGFFVGFLIVLGVELSFKGIYTLQSAFGAVCDIGSGDVRSSRPVSSAGGSFELDVRNPCHPSGFVVEERQTYRLSFAIPQDAPWKDCSIEAGPYGANIKGVSSTILMTAATPLRRHWAQPWFKPMARVGGSGTDVYPLHVRPSLSDERIGAARPETEAKCWTAGAATTFTTEFVARSSGPLFLYVNDVGMPWTNWFYENNKGAACVRIERLAPGPVTPAEPISAPADAR